jgi:uncharacterized protein (DUF1697 family)
MKMSIYIAFLRAINVGGHTVKMETLKQQFQSLGLSKVETFIASGNVIFETERAETGVLEAEIEQRLREALGYPVATFIRSSSQLAELASYQAFPESRIDAAQALNLAFLSKNPDERSKEKLMTLKTEIDDFHVYERAIYWLCSKKQSESTFSNAVLEKTLGQQSTLRGIQTIRKLAAKYAV